MKNELPKNNLYTKESFKPSPIISPIHGIISKNPSTSPQKKHPIKKASSQSTAINITPPKDNIPKERTSHHTLVTHPKTTNIPSPQKKITILENTLIISPKKITLPFTKTQIDTIIKNNSNKSQNIQQIIETTFTIPTKLYKHKLLSRLRETLKLMKKERKSLYKTINLCLEVTLNIYVYPAIITACKNSSELEIYLDCLEKNELSKFPCFNIIYKS